MTVDLLSHVENAVWHAFDFLALEYGGNATKSKLKVLTSNLGHILEVSQAENGLDHFRSSNCLSFEQYRYYLEKEVFAALPDKLSIECQREIEKRVDDVCWLICNPPYIERANPIFPEICVYQLWRIFCLLAELIETEGETTERLEVVMAAREVELVGQHFLTCMGRAEDWDPEEFDRVVSVVPAFKFSIFLAVLESKYAKEVDSGTLHEAVKDLHDMFLLDVIKKGRLKKKMELLPRYREQWLVIQPHLITVYGDWAETELRGRIPLNPQCRVEKPVAVPGFPAIKQKSHRFYLHANSKTYEFQANDHRSRLQWISSLEKAIEHSDEGVRYQRQISRDRRDQREDELAKRLSHNNIVEQTKAELEQEKAARLQAETHAALLSQQQEIEVKRMRELENIREELERLLEEEKQAKRDEEIVRALQARMLNEEWERREQLEKLQEEQKMMLEEERHKRVEYQSMKEDRERKAAEAEKRLREMEEERMKLDEELKRHREKARRVNIGQEVLEAKMKVCEQENEMKREAASRVTSLNPSASFYIRSKEDGPRYRPLRSASMRETSYSRSIRRRTRNDTGTSIASNIHIEEVNNNNSSSSD